MLLILPLAKHRLIILVPFFPQRLCQARRACFPVATIARRYNSPLPLARLFLPNNSRCCPAALTLPPKTTQGHELASFVSSICNASLVLIGRCPPPQTAVHSVVPPKLDHHMQFPPTLLYLLPLLDEMKNGTECRSLQILYVLCRQKNRPRL